MSAAASPASTAPTALIADDEPLLRDSLQRSLALLWPELRVVAQARNGREAVEMFERHRPDIAFLDVHMPGVNGMEAARQIARQAQVVFVTAFEEYALQAFERGAIDYLVKPVDEARLADTIGRLKERLGGRPGLGAAHPAALEAVIDELSRRMARAPALSVPAGGDRWEVRGDQVFRELVDVDLHEITITAVPAYLDTTVARRSYELLRLAPAPRLRACCA